MSRVCASEAGSEPWWILHHTIPSVSRVTPTWTSASRATARRAPSADTAVNVDSASGGHTHADACATNTETTSAATGWPAGGSRRFARLVDAHSRSPFSGPGASSSWTGHMTSSAATYQKAGFRTR